MNKLEKNVIGIYCGYYYVDDINVGDDGDVDEPTYDYIYYQADKLLNNVIRKEESLSGLVFIKEKGLWEAEIYNGDTDKYRYMDIDQSIFK